MKMGATQKYIYIAINKIVGFSTKMEGYTPKNEKKPPPYQIIILKGWRMFVLCCYPY